MANKIQIIVESVDKASGTFKNIGGSIAKMGATAGLAAAAGVAALGAGIVKLAKDAEPLVGIRDAFNALTADMEGGSAAMMSALQESSRGFITNTDLMKSFNTATQLVSKDFAEELPGAMDALGKVAAATGQDMGFLMDSLVTGVGRLSPMILDNLGIQVDLNQAYEDYAAKMGLVVSEMTKQEQQAALTEQAMSMLAENTADMASPQGGFAQLGVAFANIKDEIGMQLLPALTPLIDKLVQMAKDVLPILADWLSVNIPIAIAFLSDMWTNVLKPAIDEVWTFLKTTVIPWMKSTLVPWLKEYIPQAIEVFVWWWENVTMPVIKAVWEFLSNVLLPFIRDHLVPWLQEYVPQALEVLRHFWEDVLQPALEKVWKFLTVDMQPIWEALGELLGVAIPLVLDGLRYVWEEVLLPAMTAVWEFIKDKLGPVFEWFKDKVIDPIGKSLEGVSGWIDTVAGALRGLKELLGGVSIPDSLEGQSPSPFEMSLRGIADAMNELNTVSLPGMTGQLAGAGVAVGASTVNNFNLSMQTMDSAGAMQDFNSMRALAGGI